MGGITTGRTRARARPRASLVAGRRVGAPVLHGRNRPRRVGVAAPPPPGGGAGGGAGLAVMAEGGAWVLLAATVAYLVALGLASLAGSRSATVGILLAWQFAVTPLALAVSSLGALREGLLTAGLDRMIPAGLLSGGRPGPPPPGAPAPPSAP